MKTTFSVSKRINRLAWIGLAAGASGVAWAWMKRQRVQRGRQWQQQLEGSASTALVTGASAGIGRAYAARLAERGYNLVLVARREQRLSALAADFQSRWGILAEVLPADLSTEAGIAKVEQRIARGKDIDFLVNCAGYDDSGNFAEVPIETTLALINCLQLASVRLARAALPAMLNRGRGALVNVSSVGAFSPKRKDSTYVASKAYINRWTETLAIELAGTDVRVQALCPGFTLTEFHDAPKYAQYKIKERIPGWMWMTSDAVVEESLRGLVEEQVVVVPGWKNRLIVGAAKTGLSQALMKILGSFFPPSVTQPAGLIELLACPDCHGPLSKQGDEQTGTLACAACGKEYPIAGGIPRFAGYEQLHGMNQRLAHLYDGFSVFYRLFSKAAFALIGTTEDAARHEILDRLEPCGGKVLEVSIGPGVNLPYLIHNPQISQVVGLDLSTGQLAACQKYVHQQAWKVGLVQGNAETLPFHDASFESVFHIGGINFFNDRKKAIEEMIRVAKPGAKIVICDETERGARGYELVLPGFARSFQGHRDPVKPPIDLVPPEMEDIRLDETTWKGWSYCLEFRKPEHARPIVAA